MKPLLFIFTRINLKILCFLEVFLLFIGIVLGSFKFDTLSKIILCFFWGISVLGIVSLTLAKKVTYLKELFYIFLLAVLFYDLYAFKVWKMTDYGAISRIMIVSLVCVNLDFIIILAGMKWRFGNIVDFIKGNIFILSFIILFTVINLNILYSGYTTDSYSYYSSAKELLGSWNFTLGNLSALQMAGHLTIGYTIFADIGLLIIGNPGIKFIHLIMAAITIFCFYKIVLFIHQDKTKIIKIATTMIFSFSPLFLGILHGINSDFPMVCFFTWMVYCDCYNKKILKIFCSFLLCFSKEVGTIVLVMYLFGDFLYYLIKTKDSGLKKIWLYFTSFKWFNGIGILFFIFLLMFGGSGWGENAKNSLSTVVSNNTENKLLVNIDFIFYKLKEIFILNFSWLIILLGVCVIIVSIYRLGKKKNINIRLHNRLVLPIIFSFIGFLGFNLLFFTYPHYRYLQMDNFYFSLLIAYLVSFLTRKKIKQIVLMGIFIICFFIQSFYSIDPISKSVFPTIDVGEREIISTKKYISKDNHLLTAQEDSDVYSQMFFDSTLNNKDQLGFECVTEKALKEIGYNGSQNLIFPSLYGNSLEYTLLAMFGRNNLNSFYWDEKTHNITDNENDLKISFLAIDNICQKPSENIGKEFYYFQYPFSYEYKESEWLKHFKINKTTTVKYRGWNVNVLLVELIE